MNSGKERETQERQKTQRQAQEERRADKRWISLEKCVFHLNNITVQPYRNNDIYIDCIVCKTPFSEFIAQT